MAAQIVHQHIPNRRHSAAIISLADYRLEQAISAMHTRLIESSDRVEQRMAAACMCQLVGQRSHDQVARTLCR